FPSFHDLQAFLRLQLPSYMLPAAFVPIHQLPLTSNGKLDRNRLPAPVPPASPNRAPCAPPRSPLELLLADLWRQILHLDHLSLHDNFFALGGDSILAAKLATRVRAALDIPLKIKDIFELPELGALARRIQAGMLSGDQLNELPIQRAPRNSGLRLSFPQQRLWFMAQMGDGAAYNIQGSIRLAGVLVTPVLQQAIAEVVRRHEILRTVFPPRSGAPLQEILPHKQFHLPIVDLSPLTPAARTQVETQFLSAICEPPFDLAAGPLLRTALLRAAADEHILCFALHHIVADGWSLSILFREVAVLYDAFGQGRPSPLPELPVQYADFAQWQRQNLDSNAFDAQLNYWKRNLSGAVPLIELPLDRPRPPIQDFAGACEPFEISDTLPAALVALCRAESVTPFIALLSAFRVLLYRFTGQSDSIIGADLANRSRPELENLLGFFSNLLPLRTPIGGNPTFRTVLRQERESALNAFAAQDIPFEHIVHAIQPPRSRAVNPLVQVTFAMQNLPAAEFQLPGLCVQPMPLKVQKSAFDLTLAIDADGGHIRGSFIYKTALFNPETIAAIAERYQKLLATALTRPDTPIDDLRLIAVTAPEDLPSTLLSKLALSQKDLEQLMGTATH
ncbi:MAG TPA: condensation domain-containing protein, partial [Bryobacteraceae bacterium]|nr:condensation domain-containing protein [Bryobacteraceae bacterium]